MKVPVTASQGKVKGTTEKQASVIAMKMIRRGRCCVCVCVCVCVDKKGRRHEVGHISKHNYITTAKTSSTTICAPSFFPPLSLLPFFLPPSFLPPLFPCSYLDSECGGCWWGEGHTVWVKLFHSHDKATSQSNKTMVGNKPGGEKDEGSYLLSTQPNSKCSIGSVMRI